MANNQIVISRIQNRRGIRENLPQPLLPGEFALTVDTGELWIGTDPNQPPFGVRTYGSGAGDISAAENIVDNQVVSAKFTTLDQTGFEQLVDYLTATPTPAVVLTNQDILWDERTTVFIAADTSVDAANTINNIVTAVGNSPVGAAQVAQAFDALGALNDPSVDPSTTFAFDPADGDFLFTIAGSNAEQGANAATLINRIHGAQLVTTLANLQVTTTGIGVGSPTFLNWVMYNNEANLPVAATWVSADTPQTISADSVTDTMRVVAGEGITIDADTTEDYFRITNTFADIPTNEFTLTASTSTFTDITNLNFDIDNESDIIFLDYSLNISGATANDSNFTAGGQMIVVGNNNVGTGTATLTDNQVEVRDETGDTLWSNVQLLADFDGADAATSFTEESPNAAVATFNGTAQLDTAQFNSGTASLLLDGNSDNVTFPDIAAYDFGTSDWTVEGFVRFNTLPPLETSAGPGYVFFDMQNAGGDMLTYAVIQDGFGYRVRVTGDSFAEVGTISGGISTATWYHWAVTRTGGNIRAYFNGNYETGDFGAAPADMGGPNQAIRIGSLSASAYHDGWIDDVRMTVGTARYTGTSTYTIPTAPFEGAPTPYAGDVNFQANYVAGTPNRIQLQYTNTFDANATMRVVRKRWQSF